MHTDIAIIEDAKEGDQHAFRKLYDLHVDPLYRFMRQYSKDTGEVEDWVQRAFIKAFKNVTSYNGAAKFSTWLIAIALNEMKTDLRRINLFTSEGDAPTTPSQPEDDSFVWNDMMKTWLGELDEGKRAVFMLYEVEGYSHREIASILSTSENASRTMLHRAKSYLRTRWKEEENS